MNQIRKRIRAHSTQPLKPGPSGHAPEDNLRGYTWGHIQNSIEKYKSLAQEAATNGDRVIAENCYQHIDHYLRLTAEFKGRNTPPSSKNESRPSRRKRETPADDLESSIEQELMAQLKL